LAGRLAAIGRFDALFLGQLWQVYGPPALPRPPGKRRP
jgi:hypothetical protein